MSIFLFLASLTFGATLSAPIAFTPAPPTQANSMLAANPNVATANGNAVINLIFTAVDSYNNLVPGVAVVLSGSGGSNMFAATSGTTNQSGVFATTLASTLAQTQTITASFNSTSVTNTVQFTAGTPSASTSGLMANPNSAVADNSNYILAQLTLRDDFGNPVANITPTFTASGGSTTVTAAPPTSALGQSSAAYRSSLAQNEIAQVAVGGLNFSAPITFVAGPVAQATSSLVASPNALPADGSTTSTLTTTARDSQGNLVANVAVALAASGGNNLFAATNGNTTGAGTFATTLASYVGQTETITATLNGVVTETATIAFSQVADTTTSTLTTSPTSQTVGPTNGNGIIATLTLRDAQSNPIANVATTWLATGSNTSIAASPNTNASGVATAIYTSTLAQTQSAEVLAGGLSLYASMTFTAGSPNATNSVIYNRPARQLANNSNTISVYVLLRDTYGNVVPSQSTAFSASGSATTIATNGTTNANGVASGKYRTGTVQNQNALVTAGAVSLVQPIAFTQNPTVCTLSTSAASAAANGNASLTLTATVNGGAGNNTPRANLLVSFANSGGPVSFNPSSAITNASGVVTTSVSSLFAGPRKFFASTNGVQCTAQGNFIARTAFCPVNPNFNVIHLTSSCPSAAVAVGDLNKDGNQDIVTYTGCGILNVFLGSGNGTFSAPASYATNNISTSNSVVLADFNADGNLDAVVSNLAAANIGLFLGSGTGQLGPQQLFPVESTNVALSAGDVDGDGVTDLIVGSKSMATVNVLYGTSAGQFTPYVSYNTYGASNQGMSLGDFNNDGISDLVLANTAAPANCSVMLGSTPGAFNTGTQYAMSATIVTTAGVGDFNLDGNLDFAGRNNSNVFTDMYLGAGNGNFATSTSLRSGGAARTMSIDDLNGDGYPDFIMPDLYNNAVSLLLGAGDGTFANVLTLPSTIPNFLPRQIAVADFNNDSRRDFVVSNANSNAFLVFISAGCN